MFEVNNTNTSAICEISSKLTIKRLQRINFTLCSGVSIIDFKHVNILAGRFLLEILLITWFDNPEVFSTDFASQKGSEAIVRTCSVNKAFLEILQTPQENTCSRDYFLIKPTT